MFTTAGCIWACSGGTRESRVSYLKDLLVVEDVSKADHEDDDQKQQADETLQLVLFRLLVAHPSRKRHLWTVTRTRSTQLRVWEKVAGGRRETVVLCASRGLQVGESFSLAVFPLSTATSTKSTLPGGTSPSIFPFNTLRVNNWCVYIQN